jgi:Methyltransferase domain
MNPSDELRIEQRPGIRVSDRAQAAIASGRVSRIELGCGRTKQVAQAIGIDQLDAPEVDIVGDVFEALALLANGTVQQIYASHFVEHIEDLPRLVAECSRVLAADGTVEFIVPHHSNPFFYSDYTHRRAFGLYSMSYLVKDDLLRRKVPTYGVTSTLRLTDVRLGFKSPLKYSLRNLFLRSLGAFFNLSRYTQELYEELFSKLIPCYEVSYLCVQSPVGATRA